MAGRAVQSQSRSPSPPARSPLIAWLGEDGGMSGSSSEEEFPRMDPMDPPVPKWPLPPSCARDTEMYAFWDLLSRPHGMSVRKLEALFRVKHGAPSEGWLFWLQQSHFFQFFFPVDSRTGASRESALRVRRLPPEAFQAVEGQASDRLGEARAAFVQWSGDVAADRERADLRFAGAAVAPRVSAVERRIAPFSHRLMDKRSDAEALFTPFPVCNVPPTTEDDVVPPPDWPDVEAHELSDIIAHKALSSLVSYRRRTVRQFQLHKLGKPRAAKRAAPRPLKLDWRQSTKKPFKGIPMDLCVYPFKPLQPSRWPDRPPSTSLHIRAIRKEYRDHPDIPHQRWKGQVSHGNPRGAACEKIVFIDGPHGSAFQHFEEWAGHMGKEIDRGWSVESHPKAMGLTSWPVRCQPTSMVERHGSWRLCHDMSWPLPGAVEGVTSPNAAEEDVRKAKFSVFNDLAVAASCMLVAGVSVKVAKVDLPKCYKQNGQQSATRWARAYLGPSGDQQAQNRIGFGQADGPEVCSGQTDVHCFLLRREFQYAEACYPSRCAEVVAWQEDRRSAALAMGGDPLEWAARQFVLAMLDDFGMVAFDDPLFRIDGSPVWLPWGEQRTWSHLVFSILKSFEKRIGYGPLDAEKLEGPCDVMLFLGAIVDVVKEEKSLDPDKRIRYLDRLRMMLGGSSVSVANLLRMAFRLLVVCQMRPMCRQWLHSFFRAVRGKQRHALLSMSDYPEVGSDASRFVSLLASEDRIASPLAPRALLVPAGDHAVVKYEDASGPRQPGEISDHVAGFGSWSVRGNFLFYIAGEWSAEEASSLHITVLEACITFFSVPTYVESPHFGGVSHMLEFSDNTGAEWMARRETPHAPLLQRVAARRAAMLDELGLFVTTARVTSGENVWADDLSRQRVDKVEREALAIGLQPVRLEVPARWRDLSWLMVHA